MTNSTDCSVNKQFDSILVIPTLNEAQHISAVLDTLGESDAPFEIWVVDGGSDDGTVNIVKKRSLVDRRVFLFGNPDRTQAHAINLAAREAERRGGVEYLIRADAHAQYPTGWTRRLIETAKETSADSVVVPMHTIGGGPVRDAASDLFNSWLGHGGAPHRKAARGGFVEHGHHALFRLNAFLAAGGYDPRFVANEDAEFDIRLRRRGGRIYLEPRAAIGYVPRSTLRGVLRQFYRNGRYRVRTCRKHRIAPGLRQLAPTLLFAGLLAAVVAGALIHPLFFVAPAVYAGAVIIAAALIATRKTPLRIWLIAAQAVASHLAFGAGALWTMLEMKRSLKAPASKTGAASTSLQN